MNICPREDELLEAVGRGFIGPELSAHVAGCTACSELRLVAGALLDDRGHAMTEAAVPSSGSMWWRMQMRQRQETAERARRSLVIGQALTLMIAIGLVVSLFGVDFAAGMRDVIASIRMHTPILLALATCILLAPIAGYVTLRQK